MAIANQGYRVDLNLKETPTDVLALDNLAGAGIADDLRRLQNNLRNTSKIGFNTVDGAGFYNSSYDRLLEITSLESNGTEEFLSGRLYSNTVITIETNPTYLINFGDLIVIQNVTGGDIEGSGTTGTGHTIFNGEYSVTSVGVGNTFVRCVNLGVAGTITNPNISSAQLLVRGLDTFTFTDDDVVTVSTDVDINTKNNAGVSIASTTLTAGTDYYVCQSDGVTAFKLSTTGSTATQGSSVIEITGAGAASTSVTPNNFQFIRRDPVSQGNLINYIEPDIMDDAFSWLGGTSINDAMGETQSNNENSQYFLDKKYKGNKSTTTNENIKFEGDIKLRDPQNYNSTASNTLNSGGGSAAPGMYIGETRAFSTDNNPWEKDAIAVALKTESHEVSVGELAFLDHANGPITITGISNDVNTISPAIDVETFTHKIPVKIADTNGNMETYYLLLSSN